VFFLFTEFSLRQQISCLFYFPHLRYFVAQEYTLGNLEVIIFIFRYIGCGCLDLLCVGQL
jgi:hypothetical protein